jgi:hypothetical protein
VGLEQALDDHCSIHGCLMVTNADNAHHPSFFEKTLVEETDALRVTS